MAKSLAVSITQNSQSTANNTSSITVKATCTCSGDSWRGSSRTGTYTIKVLDSSGATLKTYYNATSFTSGAAQNSTTTLFSKTFTVTHDSTGYAKVTVSVVYDAASWNLTKSGEKVLTKIARSSSITSASAVTLGNAVSVKWTPANSSYAYKLKFVVGSKSYTTGYITPGTTSACTYSSYTMSIADWAPYITTATTGTCTATLYTYTSSSSSTSIGSSSKTFTVTVPSSVVPTCTASISEGNSAVGLGVYLTGQSKLKVAVTATMKYSSAISSISVKVGSTTYTASVTTTSTGATGTITAAAQSSTSVAITVTVKDKRGRSGTYSTTVTQESYSIPKINSLSIERCLANGTVDVTNGQYVLATYRYTVSNVTNNTSSMAIKYKAQSDSAYTTLKTESGVFTGTSTTYISTVVFSLETAYDFTFTVTDAITSSTQSARVATALVIMDLMEDGTGIAFGKLAETSGIMETSWPIRINTEGSNGGLKLTNTGDSGCASINVTNAWSGYSVELHVGSGGINRGVYDKTADNWIIYRNSSNHTVINNTTHIQAQLTARKVLVRQSTALTTSNAGRAFQVQATASDTWADANSASALFCCGVDSTSGYVRSYPTYNRTYSSNVEMVITTTGTFGRYSSSSARYKNTINYFDNTEYASNDGLDKRGYTIDENDYREDYRSILHLPVVQHLYNVGYMTGEPDYDYSKYTTNFIAEDVEKICPAAAVYNEDGEVESWDVKQLVPRIVAVLQEHERRLGQIGA